MVRVVDGATWQIQIGNDLIGMIGSRERVVDPTLDDVHLVGRLTVPCTIRDTTQTSESACLEV